METVWCSILLEVKIKMGDDLFNEICKKCGDDVRKRLFVFKTEVSSELPEDVYDALRLIINHG